jgi:hypothetical protein
MAVVEEEEEEEEEGLEMPTMASVLKRGVQSVHR